jgi:putative transposase
MGDVILGELIKEIHADSYGTYGVPRIHAELAARGIAVARKRIARLMRLWGIRGVTRRRWTVTTTRRAGDRPAPDLVKREFRADASNRLWVADITYIPVVGGFLYLAVVLDVWSRRVVGWSMATRLYTALVLDALEMAFQARRPVGVIHHSDQGSQYTSIAFGARCLEMGIQPSMGSVGDAYDNALCESFFATLECELLAGLGTPTAAAARSAVFAFIEGLYNTRRRHSALNYLAPAAFESLHAYPADPIGSPAAASDDGPATVDPERAVLDAQPVGLNISEPWSDSSVPLKH